jgi:hypothetical protein
MADVAGTGRHKMTQEETLKQVFQVIEWMRNDYNGATIDDVLKEIRDAFGITVNRASLPTIDTRKQR